jgi:hypothetical protein
MEEENQSTDLMSLLLVVMREANKEAREDTRYYIDKMREQNDIRKQIRRYLAALRRLRAVTLASASERGLAPCRSSDESEIRELLRQHAHEYEVGELETRLCIPARVPPDGVVSLTQLDAEIANWEDRLASAADDASLASVDLQNVLHRQQQALQVLSNVSKTTHETAMAIIRNMKA